MGQPREPICRNVNVGLRRVDPPPGGQDDGVMIRVSCEAVMYPLGFASSAYELKPPIVSIPGPSVSNELIIGRSMGLPSGTVMVVV
jgi:hypothetical protein